jgi:hypothetical protein
MTEKVKIALLVAITSIAIACLWLFYSPYQQCVRGSIEIGVDEPYAKRNCAMGLE